MDSEREFHLKGSDVSGDQVLMKFNSIKQLFIKGMFFLNTIEGYYFIQHHCSQAEAELVSFSSPI